MTKTRLVINIAATSIQVKAYVNDESGQPQYLTFTSTRGGGWIADNGLRLEPGTEEARQLNESAKRVISETNLD
jgi:hypothetical protein